MLEQQPPAASTTPSGAHRVVSRVQAWREQNATKEMVLLLVAGFLFDVLTLSRIDDVPTLLQQGAYLGLLGGLLVLEQRQALGVADGPPRLLRKVWRFSEDAIHFLFGSLLSSFALFYFKSSNFLTSALFLAVMFGLLVLNELPRFRALGPVMRVTLYSLCVTSYLAYLLPVVAGMVSKWLFLLAVLLTSGLLVWAFRAFARWTGRPQELVRRVLVPGLGVQALLLALYFLRVMPPVPLAVDWMGVFHDIRRDKADYHLQAEHKTAGFWWQEVRDYGWSWALDWEQWPYWKLWHTGDQDFRAQKGEKVMAFVRVFAPSRFDDQVVGRWYYDHPELGWVGRGEWATRLTGGRDAGFRTRFSMTYKGAPGDYRLDVTTLDGHVIGRMHVHVEDWDPAAEPRVYRTFVDYGGKRPRLAPPGEGAPADAPPVEVPAEVPAPEAPPAVAAPAGGAASPAPAVVPASGRTAAPPPAGAANEDGTAVEPPPSMGQAAPEPSGAPGREEPAPAAEAPEAEAPEAAAPERAPEAAPQEAPAAAPGEAPAPEPAE
jgi:hypothetical protein